MRRPAARTRSRSRAAMGTGTRGSWAAGGGAAGRRGGGRRSGGRQRQGCGRQHACGSLSSVELSVWEPRPKLRLRRLALASAARLHRDWRWLGPAPLFAGSAGAGAKASVDWGGLDGLDRLGRRLASFLSGDDCGVPRTARSRPGAAVQEARDGLGGLIPSAICCARAVCMAMMAAIRRRLCAHTRSCRSDVSAVSWMGGLGWGWVRSAKAGVGCTAPVRPCSPTVSAPHHTATALLPTALPYDPCCLRAPASTC